MKKFTPLLYNMSPLYRMRYWTLTVSVAIACCILYNGQLYLNIPRNSKTLDLLYLTILKHLTYYTSNFSNTWLIIPHSSLTLYLLYLTLLKHLTHYTSQFLNTRLKISLKSSAITGRAPEGPVKFTVNARSMH